MSGRSSLDRYRCFVVFFVEKKSLDISRRGARESRAVTALFEGPWCVEHVVMTDGPPPERQLFGNHDEPEGSSESENTGPMRRSARLLHHELEHLLC